MTMLMVMMMTGHFIYVVHQGASHRAALQIFVGQLKIIHFFRPFHFQLGRIDDTTGHDRWTLGSLYSLLF